MAAMNLQFLSVLLFTALLLRKGAPQCASVCGCMTEPTRCCLVLPENANPGTLVGRDNSTDTVNKLKNFTNPRFIISHTLNGTFRVAENNLTIYTERKIDRETETLGANNLNFVQNGYCILVAITVQEATIQDFILINVQISEVNDNRPTFSKQEYVIDVDETTTTAPLLVCTQEIQTQLTAVDADTESGEIEYSIANGNDIFQVENVNDPCVINRHGVELDYERPPISYSFTLVATDPDNSSLRSEVNVTYNLRDVNDNPPLFVSQNNSISILESTPIGSEIHQFQAIDVDSGLNGGSNIIYGINDGSVFQINSSTGFLKLIDTVDAEGISSYVLVISASDMGQPPMTGTIQVVINIQDVNELASITFIDQGIFEITENVVLPFASPIRRIKITDMDKTQHNRNNSIQIVAGKEFTIFPARSSTYLLQQRASVDYETNPTISIRMEVTEYGDPILRQTLTHNLTVIDQNDVYPNLTETIFNYEEENDGNQQIVNLSDYVVDDDDGMNGEIGMYELVSVRSQNDMDLTNQFAGQFSRSTGILSASGFQLDRERLGDFLTFIVNITDMGEPPLSNEIMFTVNLNDINDNFPVFENPTYTFHFRENQDVGSFVGQVHAIDADEMKNAIVNYSIISSQSQFSINESTGVIRSRESFDRELIGMYNLTIIARDSGIVQESPDSTVVIIIIDDENDDYPNFSENTKNFLIDTNLDQGSVVGRVIAVDNDEYPFNIVIYEMNSTTDVFSIRNNRSGEIILEQSLNQEIIYTINISAFNEGHRENNSVITVTISVTKSPQELAFFVVSAGVGLLVVVMIVLVVMLLLCMCCKNRRAKKKYNARKIHNDLNNTNHISILKIPATTGVAGRGRVTFKESVEETHYNEQSVVNDTIDTIRKESITKFDSSPQAPHPYVMLEPIPQEDITVVNLEMSPMNGNITNHLYSMRPHSPIIHVVGGGDNREGERDYSQGTNSSDGHTYMDDEESTFSDDDASIVNETISRFGTDHPDLSIQYETPSTHSHLELHRHLPPISHRQHNNSSLAQLHAHNLAQLAEVNRHQHYGLSYQSGHDHSLTVTSHGHLQKSSSTHSSHSPPSPHSPHHMVASSSSKHHQGTRNYPHPLVMPDAFPRNATDIHRFPIKSYQDDYGEESTYASTELDEALGFNLEIEPGIISLTATDYGDTEL